MIRRLALVVVALLSCTLAASAHARAPDTFEEDYSPPILIDSSQWFNFELKIGPYIAGDERTLKSVFGSDRGWMLNAEINATVWHVPYVGQLGVGGLWGWAKYDAEALSTTDASRAGEETKLVLYPLAALGVLRIDALARETVVPLTFAGKIGYEWVRYKATTGDRTDASGWNHGLRWGAQAAIELDFINRDSARRLDEDWEINHTYVLFEYYQSKTKGTGDATYQFGLGLAF